MPLGAGHARRRAAADPPHPHRPDVGRRPPSGAARADGGVREGDRRVHPAPRGPPGLTGLAQIHGRYHTDAEYKLGYDLQYLVNWSPVLDLEIIVRTIWVVLARRV
ncbi:sugar transferase [Phycicoccus sp. HDW14]|nr:sugar transferase [Phycicoccus sp. HDW14]